MAREIGDRKLAYFDETKDFGEIEESSFFYGLEPSHLSAVDAYEVSKVWVV